MSDTLTPFLKLTKPAVGGSRDTWGNKDNANLDVLDGNASSANGLITALTARVAALESGVATGSEIIGTVKWWPSLTGLPSGYLFCDGAIYPVASFPQLGAILTKTWGGDGVNNFAVPDLRGRVLVGIDTTDGQSILQNQYGGDAVGVRGGNAVVTLTLAQMAWHFHSGITDNQGTHTHSFTAAEFDNGAGIGEVAPSHSIQAATTDPAGLHAHNFFTDGQGGGQGHSNCQPGALGLWAIKAYTP